MDDIHGQVGAHSNRQRVAFGETTDPRVYVARPATDAAIADLVRGLEGERPVAALVGPPGLGKTLLLRRAAERLATREPALRGVSIEIAALPYSAVDFLDWCQWVLGLLGERSDRDPETALGERIRRQRTSGPRLLVTMDEAGAMPLETARALAALCAQAGRGLRLLLAATEDARASRVLSCFGESVEVVRFTRALDLAETTTYLRERLRAAGLPTSVVDRFDGAAVGRIHSLSGGVPRRIHEIARSLIEPLPADVQPAWAWRDHGWLGAPIDDLGVPAPAMTAADDGFEF